MAFLCLPIVQSESMLQCHSCTLPGKEKYCAALKRVKGAVLAFHEASRLFGSPTVPSGWGNLTTYNPPLTYPFYVHCAVWAFHQAGWSGRGSPFFSHFLPTTTVRAKPSEKSEKSLKSDFPFCLQWTFHFRLGPQPTIKVDSRSCNFIQPCLLQRLLVRVAGV